METARVIGSKSLDLYPGLCDRKQIAHPLCPCLLLYRCGEAQVEAGAVCTAPARVWGS